MRENTASTTWKSPIISGGHFAPEKGGQFGPDLGGQFSPERVVILLRIWVVNLTGFSTLR